MKWIEGWEIFLFRRSNNRRGTKYLDCWTTLRDVLADDMLCSREKLFVAIFRPFLHVSFFCYIFSPNTMFECSRKSFLQLLILERNSHCQPCLIVNFSSSVKLCIGELSSEAHSRVETSRIMCCILFLFNFLCRCNTMSLYFIFVVQTERKNSLLPFKEVSPSQFTLALVSIKKEKDSFFAFASNMIWNNNFSPGSDELKRTKDRSSRWRV